MNKWTLRTAAAACLAAVALTGLTAPAEARQTTTTGATGTATGAVRTTATVTVPYISRTRIDGVWTPIEGYTRDYTVTAPATVEPGDDFRVRFDSAPIFAVPAHNKTLTDLRIAYRVSGDATILRYRLEGGSNLGGAHFWVERNGSDLVLRSNGTFQGGVEFDVPDLVVKVRAGATGTVTTSPGGSSFADPAFYWYREQTVSGQWDPFENYVDPASPVTFTTTTIG
ncbi:hypothetical protein ABZ470_05520 [Streptosporangium sp. NPDC020072]|uniref:Uncharacterized protein n=1 Tax=Streptosporangium jomthongense TaxID=1193683 RepID=A0ABV8F7V1_9ACTN